MFLILAILGAIYLLFKLYQEGEEIGWNRILVTIFFVSYSALYLYVPPFLGMNNQYACVVIGASTHITNCSRGIHNAWHFHYALV